MKLIKKTSTLSQTWMDTFDERVEIICQGTDEDIENAIEGVIKEECEKYDDCMSWVVMDYLRKQKKMPAPDGAEYRNYRKIRREALIEFEKAQLEIQRLKKLRKELAEEKNLDNVNPYFHYQGWSEQFYSYEIVGE